MEGAPNLERSQRLFTDVEIFHINDQVTISLRLFPNKHTEL